MGHQQSKEELLFQQINRRNIEGIKSLHRNGANLECVDEEGRTPLIWACMNPEMHTVAKTLIELGANVNAYRSHRPGCKYETGTPLHHAARRGLAATVELLLAHGANALLVNNYRETPLEIARIKRFNNVVRIIEGQVCLFAGRLRERYGPSILDSRPLWVVVVPCGCTSRNLHKPFKLELAIYPSMKDALPRLTISLWRASTEDPSFSQHEYAVTISEPPRNIFSKELCFKLAPLNASDKQQLLQFCNACKGIPQVMHTAFPFNAPAAFAPVFPPSFCGASTSAIPGPSLSTSTKNPSGDNHASSCVVCLDAPVEGVCVPCGHMAGCMSCLTEIKTKKWGCPICRTKIDQIIKVYAV